MIRSHEYPIVGTWYWDIDHTERFEIVAKDDKSDNIEIQYYTGELEELDTETWFGMRVVSIAPPSQGPDAYDELTDVFAELEDQPYHPWEDPLAPFEDEK